MGRLRIFTVEIQERADSYEREAGLYNLGTKHGGNHWASNLYTEKELAVMHTALGEFLNALQDRQLNEGAHRAHCNEDGCTHPAHD